MENETLTNMADTLAELTGFAGDTAPEEGSEAQVIISKVLTGLADKLDDGPAFLRMYARACEREDANPLVVDVSPPWHACESPVAVTCGSCHASWCERCDPAPSALCHTCHGRGHSTAPLQRAFRLEAFGCYVWLDEGTLYCAEIGEFERHGIEYEFYGGEVTAPEGQAFLDGCNEVLGSSFRFDQFAGR